MTTTTTKKPRKKRESKIPVCAACGRKLRPLAKDSRNNNALAARSLGTAIPRLTANEYSELFRPESYKALALTCDGMPPTRGTDGNNLVCHKDCGHLLLVRLITVLGTDVLAHLPPQWRFRSS